MANVISKTRLEEVLNFDAKTGIFRWKIRLSNHALVGSIAGCIAKTGNSRGYVLIRIDKTLYKAHRLVWLYVSGEWPSGHIDHIDGDRSNNKFENLRDVSRSTNMQNRKRCDADSKTGFLGVTKSGRKYIAQISSNGKNFRIGTFNSPESAHAAYIEMKRIVHEGCTI
jgi:hypothetical protein